MPRTRQPKTARQVTPERAEPGPVDWREQLFNQQERGPITRVALPTEAITRLHGILFDLDPGLFRPEVVPDAVRSSPAKFYANVVAPWLARHPALAGAEVIDSGRGLHVIPRFETPVAFETDVARRRWAVIVQTVQAALPTDPCAPGITALTRPVGSVNAKNSATVTRLKAATPIPATTIIALYEQMRDRPFATVTQILFGGMRVGPCPVCKRENSVLSAFDRIGICYGACGKQKLAALYETLLAPPSASSKK